MRSVDFKTAERISDEELSRWDEIHSALVAGAHIIYRVDENCDNAIITLESDGPTMRDTPILERRPFDPDWLDQMLALTAWVEWAYAREMGLDIQRTIQYHY